MRSVILAAVLALSACASAATLAPIDAPATAQSEAASVPDFEGDVVALALSGGGARAAAFSLGVMQGLHEMRAADGRPLTQHVRLITSVSGGSILAAYFGQNGEAGLDTFRAAYLDKNWAGELHTSPFSPANWARAWRGGINTQDRFADWLDREVYAHALMRDLARNNVRVILNAADLYNGTPFSFTPIYFNALCADLDRVRIADAVAASMAVPVAFKPILAAPHPEACQPLPAWATSTDRARTALMRRTGEAFQTYRDPARLRYVHLVDGGTIDNLGLQTLVLARSIATTPFGPLNEREAVRVHRLTFLVVNAEKIRSPNWQMSAQGPSGPEAFDSYLDMTIEVENRASYDLFRAMLADWQRALIEWRCSLSSADVARLGGGANWNCRDITLAADMISFRDLDADTRAAVGAAPTRVTLPHDLTTALIDAGHSLATTNALAQSMTR